MRALSFSSRRGFGAGSELPATITLIGIFMGVVFMLFQDLQASAKASIANRLNATLSSLHESGCKLESGDPGKAFFTQGTATTPAVLHLSDKPSPVDADLVVVGLEAGVLSNGHKVSLDCRPAPGGFRAIVGFGWMRMELTDTGKP